MADNFHFDLTGVSLEKALDIAFYGAPGGKAEGWYIQPASDPKAERKSWDPPPHRIRMVLVWKAHKDASSFPAPLDAEQIIPQVKAWLSTVDYGHEPDHDGDNDKGWRVYNESWTHIGNDHYAFCAIEPVWLMYGK